MQRNTRILLAKAAVIGAVPLIIFGYAEGPPTRKTGAPGDGTCLDCHIGPRINNSPQLNVTFPNGLTYTPGVPQKLTLVVSQTGGGIHAWGFEMTARLDSDQTNGQAGTFNPADGNTQVKCDGGNVRPAGGCPASGPVEFIEHTLQGTANNTFTFTWTPPATNVGNVDIYAIANASTGPAPAGANIHLKQYTLTPVSASNPSINAQNGVVNAASFAPGISPGSWGTIQGANLSATTRTWQPSDFINGTGLPTSLDGISVSVDGQGAYVEYISPTQINFIVPADSRSGAVNVQVNNNGAVSNVSVAQLEAVAPACFLFGGKYVAATHIDFSPAASPNVVGSAVPAKPGETIILWGTGFGPVNPAEVIGQLTSGAPAAVTLPVVTIGGSQAEVISAVLSPGFAGLYQVAVVVPSSLGNGDQPVMIEVNGTQSPGALLTVQN